MIVAVFHFFPDLNEFLTPGRRTGSFASAFAPGQSVKHLVEAAGVPHTEVGLLKANGERIGFDYPVQDGDEIEVHPASAAHHLQPEQARFVLDNHLGRLAAYLRMLGFDTLYRNDYEDAELAQTAQAQDRILLTRDRQLLMRRGVRYGYCLRSLEPTRQLIEVVRRYALDQSKVKPFQRCLRCNTPLEVVSKAAVLDQLEPLTRRYYDSFHRCPACGQIYWKGSHYEHMLALIEKIQYRPEIP